MILAKVEKSKFGPWPRKCEFKVNFGIGIIDTEIEVYNLAIKYGIITKENLRSHIYKEMKWSGQPKVLESLRDDKVLRDEIVKAVIEARKLDRKLGGKLETVKVPLSIEEDGED